MAKAENCCEVCFRHLATRATALLKKDNLRAYATAQGDSMLTWKASAFHPLQPLENIHQHRARELTWGKAEKLRLGIEEREIKNYFLLAADDPVLRGPLLEDAPDPKLDLLEKRLKISAAKIMQCDRIAKNAADPDADATGDALFNALLQVIIDEQKELTAIRAQLTCRSTADQKVLTPDGAAVPIIDDAEQTLVQCNDLSTVRAWGDMRDVCGNYLGPAAAGLKRALTGGARVAMFHTIEPFYLFRLMVRFRIEADAPITDDHKRGASGVLTGLLNNALDWVIAFNKDNLRRINQALNEGSDGRWFFHLKGGRALYLLLKQKGDSDWDTQIVINPHLPPNEWYGAFNIIHDRILRLLMTFKREFFLQVHLHRDEAYYKDAEPPAEARSPFPAHTATVKAELIDVGIPRRDTVEAYEQWKHTSHRILCDGETENIPIPGYGYYIDEYLTMINEVLGEVSQSADKCFKRIHRLYDIANNVADRRLAAHIDDQVQALGDDLLVESTKLVKALKESAVPTHSVLNVMLRQFIESYELKYDLGLRNTLDAELVKLSKKEVPLPEALRSSLDSITDTSKYDKSRDEPMLQWIARMTELARMTEAHLGARATFFGFTDSSDEVQRKRRAQLGTFVKALYTSSIFKQEEELQVQFAVSGAFAAFLICDYMRLNPREKVAELEPVSQINVTLYVPREAKMPALESVEPPEPKKKGAKRMREEHDEEDSNPRGGKRAKSTDNREAALDLMRTAIAAYLKPFFGAPDINFTVVDNKAEHCIQLFWPKEEKIGEFTYTPMVITIRAVDDTWPQLGFNWGYPTLSLPDLVREYDQRAGEVEEWRRKQRLRKTGVLLKELITRHHQGPTGDVPKPEAGLPYEPPPRRPPPPPDTSKRGLQNLGATCYMNSIVKLFCGLTEYDAMRETNKALEMYTDLNAVVAAVRADATTGELHAPIQKLFNSLLKSGWDRHVTRDYDRGLGLPARSTQCDAAHLFSFMTEFKKPPEPLRIFTRTVCKGREAEVRPKDSPPTNNEWLVSPEHNGEKTVQAWIDSYFAAAETDKDAQFPGDVVGVGLKTYYMVNIPAFIIFKAWRFRFRPAGTTKVLDQIAIGDSISLPRFTLAEGVLTPAAPVKMVPCGVVVHHGSSLLGGHYTYYELRGGKWFHHDDRSVTEVPAKDIEDQPSGQQSHYLTLFRPPG